MEITQLGYFSRANIRLDTTQLLSVLEVSVANNERHGITGFLINGYSWYFQLIEGPQREIEYLFQKIAKDDRHMVLESWIEECVGERDFSEWRMGMASVADAKIALDQNVLQTGRSTLRDKIDYIKPLAETYR